MIFKPLINPFIILAISLVTVVFMTVIILRQPKKNRKPWIRRLCVLLLLLLMALRPSVAGGMSQGGVTNLDVTFVVDTTSSMAAEDFDGNKTRLSGVRKDIENLTNNLAGARFSIIYFDSNAYSALPFTTDTTAVITQAKTLNQEITYYSRGSSIDRPLDLLKAQFENAEKNKPERARMIVYFGDGEQTADSEPKSFSELKKYLDGGLVLGYGTASGGKMKEYSGYASDKELPYIKDYSSKAFPVPDALSKIDETNLQNIASQLGVQYQRRSQNTDTSALAKSLNVGKLVKKTRDVKGSTDLYWIMTIFVAALLLFDIKRILDMREELKIGKNHE